jgi:AraC-like DNA-binding protein
MPTDRTTLILDETREASDIEGARQLLSGVAPGAAIPEADPVFSVRRRTVGDERLQLTRFDTSGFVHARVEISRSIGIGRLHRGGLRAESNGAEVDPGQPFLLSPGAAEVWTSSLHAEVVSLTLPALSVFTGTDVGTAVRFPRSSALSPELRHHWDLTLAHVGRIFDDGTLLRNDLIRQAAVDAVFAATISTFGVETDHHDTAVAPAAVHRATAYIDSHLADPMSVADIAAAARLSVRGLQNAFQRTLGTTPAAYVRTARLAEVRRDLQRADADGTTVAEVAHRWGFAHLPRFAQHYRAEFGEQPKETLRG